jgi:hypothetical protein
MTPLPLTITIFPSGSVDFSLKDDVAVILLHGLSFVYEGYLVESYTAGIGLTSLQALHQKLLNVFTALTNTLS